MLTYADPNWDSWLEHNTAEHRSLASLMDDLSRTVLLAPCTETEADDVLALLVAHSHGEGGLDARASGTADEALVLVRALGGAWGRGGCLFKTAHMTVQPMDYVDDDARDTDVSRWLTLDEVAGVAGRALSTP